MKAIGYRPNLSARRRRSQHSSTVGLIVSDIRNPFFTTLSRAVEDAAYRADMRVVLCNTDENPAREAMYLRLMQEERITGVIYAPTRKMAETLASMDLDFPVVLVDRTGPTGWQDAVGIDNAEAAGLLVDHLVAEGHRRIVGFFGNTSSTAAERHGGYAAAMARHRLPTDACFLPPVAEAAEAELMRRLSAGERPDAVMVSNGLMLLGLYRGVRRAGLETPRDIAIAGFDNETWTEATGAICEAAQEVSRGLLHQWICVDGLPPRLTTRSRSLHLKTRQRSRAIASAQAPKVAPNVVGHASCNCVRRRGRRKISRFSAAPAIPS